MTGIHVVILQLNLHIMKELFPKFSIQFILFLLVPVSIFAQVKIASDTSSFTPAHPSAVLEVFSKTKGFLPPKLTTTERNAIVSPAEGLVIFNLDEDCINVFQTAAWQTYCTIRYSSICGCVEYLNNYGLTNESWIEITSPGIDGINCWDLNENGILDPTEDIVNDGVGNSLDCQGLAGPIGPQGPPGVDGVDGAVGAQGPPGASGADGIDGADGTQGPPGADGADGIDGAVGPQGPPGVDGVDGAVGAQGPPGLDGVDGMDGAPGVDGIDGAVGAQGPPGADGADGVENSEAILIPQHSGASPAIGNADFTQEVNTWDIDFSGSGPYIGVLNGIPDYGTSTPYRAIETTFMVKVSHDGTDTAPEFEFVLSGVHNTQTVGGILLNPQSGAETVLVFKSVATHGSLGGEADALLLIRSSYEAPVVSVGGVENSEAILIPQHSGTTPAIENADFTHEVNIWDIDFSGSGPYIGVLNGIPDYGTSAPYRAIETTFMVKVSHDGTDTAPEFEFVLSGVHNTQTVGGILLNPQSGAETILVFKSVATHGSLGGEADALLLIGSSYIAPVASGDGRDSRILRYPALTATTGMPLAMGSMLDLDRGFNHLFLEPTFNIGATSNSYRVHIQDQPSYDNASTPAEYMEAGYAYFVTLYVKHDGLSTNPRVIFYENNTHASLSSEEIPLDPTPNSVTKITLYVTSNHGFVGGGEAVVIASSYEVPTMSGDERDSRILTYPAQTATTGIPLAMGSMLDLDRGFNHLFMEPTFNLGAVSYPYRVHIQDQPSYDNASTPAEYFEAGYAYFVTLYVKHDGLSTNPRVIFYENNTHASLSSEEISLDPTPNSTTKITLYVKSNHGYVGGGEAIVIASSYEAPTIAGDGRDNRILAYPAQTATTGQPLDMGSMLDLDRGFNHLFLRPTFNIGATSGTYRVHIQDQPSYDNASTPAEYMEAGYAYFVTLYVKHDGLSTNPRVLFYENNSHASLSSEEIPLDPTPNSTTKITLYVTSNHGFIGGGEAVVIASSY